MTIPATFGNGHLSDADLQILLMERAARLHDYVGRRIPPPMKSVLSAEDVLQEVWLAAFRALPDFNAHQPNALDRWLTTITDRKMVDAIRRARRVKRGGRHRMGRAGQRQTSSCLDLFGRIAGGQRTPSSEEGAREARHAVRIALDALPENYRQAITLFHLQGLSRAEVARAMQMSVSAVHGVLYRALAKLREHLGPAARFFSDDRLQHGPAEERVPRTPKRPDSAR